MNTNLRPPLRVAALNRAWPHLRHRASAFLAALVIGHCSLVISAKLTAATFELEKAGIAEIQAAVDAGFSSVGGQTKNPHNLGHGPSGSSGGTGAGLAAWFAPLGLGTDTGGSIRGPSSANGVPGIKPTNGLLSRSGIIPRVLTFDTGGPMARTISDVALSLGYMTGVDPKDPLTQTSAGLFLKDYTPFLKKDSLKGARLGIIRDLTGLDPEVDKVFNAAVAELKSAGAIVIDDLHYPAMVTEGRAAVMDIVRGADVREDYAKYFATLKGDYPRTLSEMIARADAFTEPHGKLRPYPAIWARFKIDNAGEPSTSLTYRAAKEHGMAMVRMGVLGIFEKHQLDAIVYPTRPKRPDPLNPDIATYIPKGNANQSLTAIANVTQFPDVIVPAGVTENKLPVTLSFMGPAYSEARMLAYAYAYEQAFPRRVSPSTTPALPGEKFDY